MGGEFDFFKMYNPLFPLSCQERGRWGIKLIGALVVPSLAKLTCGSHSLPIPKSNLSINTGFHLISNRLTTGKLLTILSQWYSATTPEIM